MDTKFLSPGRKTAWLIGASLIALVVGCLTLFFPHPKSQVEPSAPPVSVASSATPASAKASFDQNWTARIAAATPADFPSLIRKILADKPSPARDQALAAIISGWIKRNPQGLRDFLDTLGLDDDDGGLAAQFFAALPSALPYVSDQAATSPYLSELVSQLIQNVAADDPQKALVWAEKWLLGDSLDEARVTIAGVLAKQSPADALKLLSKIQNPLRRVHALSAIAEGYAGVDPDGARAWAAALPHDAEVATAMDGVLRVMAEKDPAAAGAAFQAVQKQIAGNYSHLVAADRKRRGLPENPPLDAQGNPIVDDAGGEDVLPAVSPDLDLLADSASAIARGMAETNPAAALQWTDSLPGVLKTGSTRAALSAWAETQPEQAYRYCQTNQWSDAETFGNIFSSWAEANPVAAATEATTVDNQRLRGEAISGAVSSWAGQSQSASDISEWINRLPLAADRDAANLALATSIDADQPKAAWSRAILISNPTDRDPALSSAFASMVASQPNDAAAVLASATNLTTAERGTLSRMLDPRTATR